MGNELRVYEDWSEATRQKAKDWFKAMDADGNGSISKGEHFLFLSRNADADFLKTEWQREFEAIWKSIDVNGDEGRVNTLDRAVHGVLQASQPRRACSKAALLGGHEHAQRPVF